MGFTFGMFRLAVKTASAAVTASKVKSPSTSSSQTSSSQTKPDPRTSSSSTVKKVSATSSVTNGLKVTISTATSNSSKAAAPLPTYSNLRDRATGVAATGLMGVLGPVVSQVLSPSALQKAVTSAGATAQLSRAVSVDDPHKVVLQQKNGSVTYTSGNQFNNTRKTEVIAPPKKIDAGTVAWRNQQIEDEKLKHINAQIRNDQGGQTNAANDAAMYRGLGGTLGSGDETAATRALKRYYNEDSTVRNALNSRTTYDLNAAIVKVKNDQEWAARNNDTAGLKAAKALEDNLRQLGGTISAGASLQQSQTQLRATAPSRTGSVVTPEPVSYPTKQPVASSSGIKYDKSDFSNTLDNTPVVNSLKGAVEVITGKNAVTGDDLSTLDRVLAGLSILVPGARGIGKVVGKTEKVTDAVSETVKTERHHIATDKSKKFDFKNHPAFKETGINVSKDIDNLVDLANHRGRHTNKYHQEVQDRLDAVYNRYGGSDKLEGAVRSELRKMKQELLDGTLDPYGK